MVPNLDEGAGAKRTRQSEQVGTAVGVGLAIGAVAWLSTLFF